MSLFTYLGGIKHVEGSLGKDGGPGEEEVPVPLRQPHHKGRRAWTDKREEDVHCHLCQTSLRKVIQQLSFQIASLLMLFDPSENG